MLESAIASWGALLLLGGIHGVNPGMGWLFAVALGLQEGSGRAVWRALPPLLVGHLAAMVAAVGVGMLLGFVVEPEQLRWIVAASLVALGVVRLRRHGHGRFTGMRVSARDLAVWSFLMASAHGAGLMALPFIPAAGESAHAGHVHVDPASTGGAAAAVGTLSSLPTDAAESGAAAGGATEGRGVTIARALAASGLHTLGYLVVTGLVAALVFYRFGLRMLQRVWFNVDLVWAGSLIATGVLVLVS